jgi:hypothetical protein
MLFENPALDRTTIGNITISANAKGVLRKLPVIQSGWTSTFLVNILNPIITGDVFREMLEFAGMFIGLGHYRPQYGGTNGRFRVSHLEWQDHRRKVA